ncbi:MAG: OB-fold domain-containing protein [Thermodesulfobacteriota bacterium]
MTEEKAKAGQPSQIPIWPNLFTYAADGAPRLICSRCRECRQTFYPQEAMCPACHQEGTLERVEVDGRGRLISFSRVTRGLPGYDSPYCLACVELDEGPALIAQLEEWRDQELKIGLPVSLVIGRIKVDPKGNTLLGPKFRVRGGQ